MVAASALALQAVNQFPGKHDAQWRSACLKTLFAVLLVQPAHAQHSCHANKLKVLGASLCQLVPCHARASWSMAYKLCTSSLELFNPLCELQISLLIGLLCGPDSMLHCPGQRMSALHVAGQLLQVTKMLIFNHVNCDLQIREGLESGGASDYQRQVAQARLLGELYNYRVLDSR